MFFSEVSKFPDVNEGRIELLPFLEASKGIVRFVEFLGSVFIPVKNDIQGNIDKLLKIHLSDEQKFLTLNDIIEHEVKEDKSKIGIDALLWLKRGLEYVYVVLSCLVNESKCNNCPENLVPFFTKAYEEKLKPYHGWLVQKIFGVMICVAPSRKSLVDLMAGGATEEKVLTEAESYLQSLNKNLDVINNIYKEKDLDSDQKV